MDYQPVLDSQSGLLQQQDQCTNVRGDIVLNLVATWRAFGGGWQIRAGQDFIPEDRQEPMRERSNRGNLIPGDQLANELPEAPPTGQDQPLLN